MGKKVTYNVTLIFHFSLINLSDIFVELSTSISFAFVIILLFCQMVVQKGGVGYVG